MSENSVLNNLLKSTINSNSARVESAKNSQDHHIKQLESYAYELVKNYNKYKHFNVDIRNSSILKKMFLKLKKNLKLIIHCAGQPSHDLSKKNISS